MGKFEMHVHTSECDLAAKCAAADIVKLYHNAGYDGMVVTDHYFSMFYNWFEADISGCGHKGIIDRYLRGYYAAKNEGEKLGFTVLCGAEVRFDGTINDYLLYGANEQFFYNSPLLNRMSGLDELFEILPHDILVVQAHPFRNKMTVCDPSPLFGIEVYNGGTEAFRNDMANTFATHYGKAKTSGSDFHSEGALARGGIATDIKIKSEKDLVSVLQSGNYSLIKSGEITENA